MTTTPQAQPRAELRDFGVDREEFLSAVLDGLARPQKSLPCKFLYDERGSLLFEEICELEEYYPTRTEIGLLRARAGAIAELAGPDATLVEFGSGASVKVRILLDALPQAGAYVPVDISREHLLASAEALAADRPGLTVLPVCADYTRPFELPETPRPRAGFFPGSTIGNLAPPAAVAFLAGVRAALGPGSALVIGVDLRKDERILLPAYDDARGVTAAFNLNLLARINRELDGTFDLDGFAHEARYDRVAGKIEMHLRSLRAQTASVAGVAFDFAPRETIHTEDSYKYTLQGFRDLARRAGWTPVASWTDDDALFSLHFLRAPGAPAARPAPQHRESTAMTTKTTRFDDLRDNDHARASGPPANVEGYRAVRRFTERLAAPLVPEDTVVQTMPDVSPTKWHLAHVSWFFETFLLRPFLPGYRSLDERYAYLFNSYYVQAGERHCRARRGEITRPTLDEVRDFRAHVDAHMERLLARADDGAEPEIARRLEIGLHHEQQHQELLLTDIKHVLSCNPLRPAYHDDPPPAAGGTVPELRWLSFDGGLHEVGHDGCGFAYDCEGPRHRCFVEPFELASRPVTNAEVMAFIEDRGYRRAELWLSDGWATVQAEGWTHPFYWERHDDGWYAFTLAGMRAVDPDEPASHISYFEANAIARWLGARLPTEQEWEVAAGEAPIRGHFADDGRYQPAPPPDGTDDGLSQLYGDVWEWTRSPFAPYPGYRPEPGALGEYNGKFMCNQFVLRGGSCATPADHVRPTYRNFFPPAARWQFTGFRLARDA